MAQLLNIAYLLVLLAASPWLIWEAIYSGKYREGWRAKLWGQVPQRTGNSRCLWLHAVSVGEVNLLVPLIERWERRHPDWEVVISTTTRTGFQLAQKRFAPRTVFYCPLDFTWAVRRAMRSIRPDLLVLTELELWPNLIRAAQKCGSKVAVINGRLSDKSHRRYRLLGGMARRLLAPIDLVAAQNQEYADRFLSLGASPAALHVTGSIKFDGVRFDRNNADTRRLAALAEITESDLVFLAGSTQEPEEQLSLQTYCALSPLFPELRLILVPRHPERFDAVAEMLARSGVPWQRRSELPSGPLPTNADAKSSSPPPRVLLVDAVGELGAWWGTAQIAFVGGSLGQRGGQNMIEPSAYGAAVAFGPNTWNFRDVVAQLLAREAAIVVRDGGELTGFVRDMLADPERRIALGRRAQQLVEQQQGAADRTIELLDRLLDLSRRSADRYAA
jgi:3-deoxy-D-manno-octulosonic-acid transferase